MFSYRIDTSYEKWFWYEKTPPSVGSSHKKARIEKVYDENEDYHLTDMINDAESHFVDHPNELTKILEEIEKPIYLSSNITNLPF